MSPQAPIFFIAAILFCTLALVEPAPAGSRLKNPEEWIGDSLDRFLEAYYDRYLQEEEDGTDGAPSERRDVGKGVDIYEEMQGDQPVENRVPENQERNMTEMEYIRAMRDRSKHNRLQVLRQNILQYLGRINATSIPKTEDDTRLSYLNMTQFIPSVLNNSNILNDDQITEKIRSFYPSCEIPSNIDQDLWKDDEMMNLHFNFEYPTDNKNANIATATLRLYRLPQNGTKVNSKRADCDYTDTTEDEKLMRVSIYWYTKSKKRRGMKRRLSDSRVVSDSARWVELSVRPAAKAWLARGGRNLGLAVTVEDQEGNTLRPAHLFKGPTCMVGTSTPKPIPTIIVDAARRSGELNRIHSLLGRNTTAAVYSDVQLLPVVDICTVEFPDNFTQPAHLSNLRVNACNLKKIHEDAQRLVEKEKFERLATLPVMPVPSSRHIRHQRQHLANKKQEGGVVDPEFDPRSKIVDSTILITNEELESYTKNFTDVNR